MDGDFPALRGRATGASTKTRANGTSTVQKRPQPSYRNALLQVPVEEPQPQPLEQEQEQPIIKDKTDEGGELAVSEAETEVNTEDTPSAVDEEEFEAPEIGSRVEYRGFGNCRVTEVRDDLSVEISIPGVGKITVAPGQYKLKVPVVSKEMAEEVPKEESLKRLLSAELAEVSTDEFNDEAPAAAREVAEEVPEEACRKVNWADFADDEFDDEAPAAAKEVTEEVPEAPLRKLKWADLTDDESEDEAKRLPTVWESDEDSSDLFQNEAFSVAATQASEELLEACGVGEETDNDKYVSSTSCEEEPQQNNSEVLAPEVGATSGTSSKAMSKPVNPRTYMTCHWPVDDQGNFDRTDSINRTAFAALSEGCHLHIISKDVYRQHGSPQHHKVLSLKPDLLKRWAPTSQSRLSEILEELMCSASAQNNYRSEIWISQCEHAVATLRHAPTFRDAVEGVVESADFERMLLLDLCDPDARGQGGSCALRFYGEDTKDRTRCSQKMLIALGGVLDMNGYEKRVLLDVCRRLKEPSRTVSLGCRQELTSKCIKILEAADSLGWLHAALQRCESEDWCHSTGLSCPPDSWQKLHFVKILDEHPRKYAERDEAHKLLVDTFMFSKGSVPTKISLTLIGDNVAVTLYKPKYELLKKERCILDGRWSHRFSSMTEGLRAVLNEFAPLKEQFILHAVDDHAAAPLCQPATPHAGSNSHPMSVVLAPRKFAMEVSAASKGAAKSVCASAGRPSSQVAFIGSIFNEGLLGPALRDQPARVTPSTACLAERPKVERVPRTNAWARPLRIASD